MWDYCIVLSVITNIGALTLPFSHSFLVHRELGGLSIRGYRHLSWATFLRLHYMISWLLPLNDLPFYIDSPKKPKQHWQHDYSCRLKPISRIFPMITHTNHRWSLSRLSMHLPYTFHYLFIIYLLSNNLSLQKLHSHLPLIPIYLYYEKDIYIEGY